MKAILALLATASLVACNNKAGDESARVGGAVDTTITTRSTQDTTVVTRDTTVSVDTNTMEGDKATRVDTTRRTRSSTDTAMRADTGSNR
jgi:hypothetical protein